MRIYKYLLTIELIHVWCCLPAGLSYHPSTLAVRFKKKTNTHNIYKQLEIVRDLVLCHLFTIT